MNHPFVALMRRYCIDYTNSHDLSVCDEIMRDDYEVHIAGMTLPRDTAYKPAVCDVFERFPNLGLIVHELHTNGDRLVMRFSEHAATVDGAVACWAGIGMYDWDGERLLTCRVEQDFWSQRRQLDSGTPDALEPPHLDPWSTTVEQPADPEREHAVRRWLDAGDLTAFGDHGQIDERLAASGGLALAVERADVLDLFSAGDRVAVHATLHGRHTGSLDGVADGRPMSMDVVGLVDVDDAGAVRSGHIVTDRFGAWMRNLGEA